MSPRMKQGIYLALKILGLTLGMFICSILSSRIAGITDSNNISQQLAQARAWSLLLVCLLNTLVLAFYVLKARIGGKALLASVFLIHFGITTFLSQIESLVFLKYLVSITSLELIGRIVVQETILSILVSLIFVWGLGKTPNRREDVPTVQNLTFSRLQWVGKFAVICVIYVFIYFCFGYFVAWQTPAVQKFYAGLTLPSWMLFFQFFRAVIWGLIALLIIKTIAGKVWQAGLITGLLFSVLMASGLLMAGNPIMPDAVRLAHFREIISSNFLFGWFTVGVLNFGAKRNNPAFISEVKA